MRSLINLICLLSITLLSCGQSKESKFINPNVCTFNKERKSIKTNYEYSYDIISVIKNRQTLDDLSTERGHADFLGVAIQIYNYGNNLKINPYAVDDVYDDAFAPITHFYNVTPDNISISFEYNDELYGKWAKGDVFVKDFKRFYSDVFISPLAYNALIQYQNNEKMEDYLILARLVSLETNSTFLGIFLGDIYTANIIESHYSLIATKHDISFNSPDNKECPLWQSLLSESEHNLLDLYYRYYDANNPDDSEFSKKIHAIIER